MASATVVGEVAAGTITTAFSTATTAGAANGDGATAVTVNGAAANVAQAGTIAQATTGAVQFTTGIADNIDAMVNAEGAATAAFGFATDGTADT